MLISSSNILLFDLDGTLLETDLANFYSYKKACYEVLGITLSLPYTRFDYRFLKDFLKQFNIDDTLMLRIKLLKDLYYKDFIFLTKINEYIKNVLVGAFKTNKTILVTNANKNRVSMLLDHHSLSCYFSHIFINKKQNKFSNLLNFYNLNPKKIILFENEKTEIQKAISVGILAENIVEVKI